MTEETKTLCRPKKPLLVGYAIPEGKVQPQPVWLSASSYNTNLCFVMQASKPGAMKEVKLSSIDFIVCDSKSPQAVLMLAVRAKRSSLALEDCIPDHPAVKFKEAVDAYRSLAESLAYMEKARHFNPQIPKDLLSNVFDECERLWKKVEETWAEAGKSNKVMTDGLTERLNAILFAAGEFKERGKFPLCEGLSIIKQLRTICLGGFTPRELAPGLETEVWRPRTATDAEYDKMLKDRQASQIPYKGEGEVFDKFQGMMDEIQFRNELYRRSKLMTMGCPDTTMIKK